MSQKHAPKQMNETLFKQAKPVFLVNKQKLFRLIYLAELLGSNFDFVV